MNGRRALVAAAAMMLAACGGDGGEAGQADGTAVPDTTPSSVQMAPTAEDDTTPGKVDTAGVGTNPPTAGGQIVDTASVPGPTDTVHGTRSAP